MAGSPGSPTSCTHAGMEGETSGRTPPTGWHAAARVLLGEPALTGPEVAAAAGYPYEQARRLWQAMGLPPVPEGHRIFTAADVDVVRLVRVLEVDAAVDAAVVLRLTRVMGRSMTSVADAFLAALRERAAAGLPEVAAGDAEQFAGRVAQLARAIEPMLVHVWRHELLAALLRVLGDASGEDAIRLAVGFADLVGYTALAQQLEEAELAALIERFETLAYARIVERGGRVVKMIGDEVLFVADDAPVAADAALALIDACLRDATLPPVRVGLALGPVLPWEGDLYGTTVNLASRLVALARPGTVLASDALAAALDPTRFVLRRLRPLRLRGIGPVRVWVVRPPAPEAEDRSG